MKPFWRCNLVIQLRITQIEGNTMISKWMYLNFVLHISAVWSKRGNFALAKCFRTKRRLFRVIYVRLLVFVHANAFSKTFVFIFMRPHYPCKRSQPSNQTTKTEMKTFVTRLCSNVLLCTAHV